MENWKEKYEELNEAFNKFKKDYEEFIHLAAHDLDSPLRKLLTFADRLDTRLKDIQDESAKLYLDRIKISAEQMRAVVDSLYNLSVVNVGKTSFEDCDLEKIIRKTLDNFQEEIREKHAVIETSGLPIIKANENQLMLLFKNIFDNAFKFSNREGQLKINIEATVLDDDEKTSLKLSPKNVYHKISVADNGIGFPQEQAENIFKPFVRLHGRSAFPGSGLGLSICKKIVENHKGFIYTKDTQNSGACFVLILPQKTE